MRPAGTAETLGTQPRTGRGTGGEVGTTVYVAWRDMRFARGRFALMGLVVTLTTLLVVLLSGLAAGLGRASTSAVTGLPADHLAFAAPGPDRSVSFTASTVTERQWRGWAAVPGVRHADPLGVSAVTATVGGRTAALSAFGAPPGSGLAPAGDRLAAGRVVLSAGAADALDARPGQAVRIGDRTLTVAAVAGDASYSHAPVVWTALSDWQQQAPGGAAATVVALTTSGHVDLAAADRALHTRTLARADAVRAVGSYTAENSSLQLMRGLLFVIGALVVGAFFAVWTIQRSRDIAVLKALGARTATLLRDALGQAVAVLVTGAAVGTAVAVAVGAAVAGVVPFALTAGSVLLPALVTVVLGAAAPGWPSAGSPPSTRWRRWVVPDEPRST